MTFGDYITGATTFTGAITTVWYGHFCGDWRLFHPVNPHPPLLPHTENVLKTRRFFLRHRSLISSS